jgi:hypothetical protein
VVPTVVQQLCETVFVENHERQYMRTSRLDRPNTQDRESGSP